MLTNKMIEDALRYLYECACEAKMKRKHHDKAQNSFNICLMALKSSEGQLNQNADQPPRPASRVAESASPQDVPPKDTGEGAPRTNVMPLRPRDQNHRRNVE